MIKFHNPEEYDDEHIETDDGWRCLTEAEAVDGQMRPDDLEYYDDDDCEWVDASQAGTTEPLCDITYRTRAPMPDQVLSTLINLIK
jgi:hypothetical protein